jgi:hypothetical protein
MSFFSTLRILVPATLFFMFLSLKSTAQDLSIKGTVKDSSGVGLPAASVLVKNSNRGTSTNKKGEFDIQAGAHDSLLISSIGFADTTIFINGQTSFAVVLRAKPTQLRNVEVNTTVKNSDLPPPTEAVNDQIIANTFADFDRMSSFSSGASVTEGYYQAAPGSPTTPGTKGGWSPSHTVTEGFGALNGLNSGTMLPVMTHKEVTKGSRYLLERSTPGIVVEQGGTLVKDSSYLLNYDKIDGRLLLTQDGQQYLEVDPEKVMAFAFKSNDTSYVFINVPLIDKQRYYILVGIGPRYAIYKSLKTKFVKSTDDNYRSNGLTDIGNNYDEYVDNISYYFVDFKNNAATKFDLKKKSLKDALGAVGPALDKYMNEHKRDDLDDSFLKNLNHYLNGQP